MDGFKDSTKMKYMMGGDVSAYKTGGTVKKAMGGACGPMKKAVGGAVGSAPMQGNRQGPATSAPTRGPATANPKSGGVIAGLRQMASKSIAGSPKTGESSADYAARVRTTAMDKMKAASKPKVTTPRTSTRDSETDGGRGASKLVKKAMGKPDMYKPNIARNPTEPAPTTQPTKGTAKVGNPLTKGKRDMYEPQISGGPVPYGKGGPAKKGVPAHNSRPMIGRRVGGLAVMPKGKC